MENKQLSFGRVQAAGVLGVPIRTVDRLIATKELPSFRIGKRRVISAQALEKFVKKMEAGSK